MAERAGSGWCEPDLEGPLSGRCVNFTWKDHLATPPRRGTAMIAIRDCCPSRGLADYSQVYLTQFIHRLDLESQLPHKIFNLLLTITN